jgi:hypothetical protein
MFQFCRRRCRYTQLQYLLANPSIVNDDGIAMQSLYSRITGILISGADSGFMFNVCTFQNGADLNGYFQSNSILAGCSRCIRA